MTTTLAQDMRHHMTKFVAYDVLAIVIAITCLRSSA